MLLVMMNSNEQQSKELSVTGEKGVKFFHVAV